MGQRKMEQNRREILKHTAWIGAAVMAVVAFPVFCVADVSKAWELIPPEREKPLVFSSAPRAFVGSSTVETMSFPVNGNAIFGDMSGSWRDFVLVVKARATDDNTMAAELGLHQKDGKTWGATFPLERKWREIRISREKLKYFSHWPGMPPLADGETLELRKLINVHVSFGKWLCRGGLEKPHGFEIESMRIEPGNDKSEKKPSTGPWDLSLADFPRLSGETDDTARLDRAIYAAPSGVLYIPRGVYDISSPIEIKNRCSLLMHKSATLRAVREMPCMLVIDGRTIAGFDAHDYNCFVSGGRFDGNGLASCVRIDGFVHFTIRDATILNGRTYGLEVKGGCEIIADNLYLRCVKSGLAGNTGIRADGGDSHYTDCIVTDYTIGFDVVSGGANRLTRCHVWGGPLPPVRPGEPPEMLKDSIGFKIEDGGSTILRDCFADTSKTGYLINGWDTRLLGCSYFNNYAYRLDDVTVIRHTRGRLYVADGHISKNCPKMKVYEGNGQVVWHNMTYASHGGMDFGQDDECPGMIGYPTKPNERKCGK